MHYFSSTEVFSAMKSIQKIFDFAVKFALSDAALSLLIESASCILHAIAQLDKVSNSDSEWQWEERSQVFTSISKTLQSWIVKGSVIGGTMFGGSIPSYGKETPWWKDKGKRELQVHMGIVTVLDSRCTLMKHMKLFS